MTVNGFGQIRNICFFIDAIHLLLSIKKNMHHYKTTAMPESFVTARQFQSFGNFRIFC